MYDIAGASYHEKADLFDSLDQRLRANWTDVVIHHPRAYFEHRYRFFASLLTRSPWGLWAPVFDTIDPNDLGVPVRAVKDSYYFAYVKRLAKSSVVFVPLLSLAASPILATRTG